MVWRATGTSGTRRAHCGQGTWDRARAVNAVGHAVARFAGARLDSVAALGLRGLATYALELIVVGGLYFALAKLGTALASLHPSIISLPAGLALAAVLLCG